MPSAASLRGTLLCLLVWSPPAQAQDDDRIWGRVETTTGTHEGFIRWDRNEVGWVDQLDGLKVVPDAVYERWRAAWDAGEPPVRTVELRGYRISWDEVDPSFPAAVESGVRFGHVASVRVLGFDAVEVTLKSGQRVEMRGGASDFGEGMRGLIVTGLDGREHDLPWELRSVEIGRGVRSEGVMAVELGPAPAGARAPARRLYGIVEDRGGRVFTGYLSWDLDEVLTTDVLDGYEDGRDREISFDEISRIERHLGGANVTLVSGRTLYLRGTNDVGDGHRGVQISDPGLGMIEVEWDDLASVAFEDAPPPGPGFDAFDGGRPLFGTVLTRAGEEIRGFLRWNAHKERTWETLVGHSDDVLFRIELGLVDRISRGELSGARVHVEDGRTFDLDGTSDVSWDSYGVFVSETGSDGDTGEGGEWRLVTWDELDEVRFERAPAADTVERGPRGGGVGGR